MSADPGVAIVTGASSGVGLAVARGLLADGWEVLGVSRRTPLLASPRFMHHKADLAVWWEIAALAGAVRGRAVDALIHCAAQQGPIGTVEDVDPIAWRRALAINLLAPFMLCRELLPALRQSGDGRILLFAGGGSHFPFPRYSSYACAKAAVVRLVETLALELADQPVTVNAVAPGMQPTEIHLPTLEAGPERAGLEHYTAVGDLLETDDGTRMATVVNCVRHLLSDRARGLTGKTIAAQYDRWQNASDPDEVRVLNASKAWTTTRLTREDVRCLG